MMTAMPLALVRRALLASLAWLWCAPGTGWAASPGPVPVLAVEAALSSGEDRVDERLGVLLRALEHPEHRAEARARIRQIVLDAPPRSAWAPAYGAALDGAEPEPALQLAAAVAALQLPEPGPEPWTALETLVQEDAPQARRHWGEALLFHGRVAAVATTDLVSPLHRAWGLVAQGDAGLALGTLTAPEAQPCLESNDDRRCSELLLSLGWPKAAVHRARLGLARGGDREGLDALIERAEGLYYGRPRPETLQRAAAASAVQEGGNAVAALVLWQEACAVDPAAWEVLGPALGLAFELGQPEVAVALLQAALEAVRGPDDWTRMLRDLGRVTAAAAETWKTTGDPHRALQALHLAHALLPMDPSILTSLGGVSWQLDQPLAALEAYAAAAELGSTDPSVQEARFRLLVQLDRLDEAGQLLEGLPRDDVRAQALRQELSLEVSLRSTAAQLQAGDVTGARVSVDRLRQDHEEWPRVQALHGEVLLASGEPGPAAAAFERARRQDPENPWHALGEARALGQLGLWTPAHQLIEGLGTALPADVLAVANHLRESLLRSEGDALRASGNWSAAWARYDALLAGTPDAWTLTGAGALYLAAERHDDALAAYDQALSLDPDNPVAARGRVWALLGQGRIVEAEAQAEALVARDRDPANDNLLAHVRRQDLLQEALLLRFGQQPEQAEALLLAGLSNAHQDPELLLALGWLYEQQGRLDDAWWRAREVLVLDPTHRDALHLLRTVGRGRAAAVHRSWQDAADAGAGPEVSRALPALRLAIELERAEEMASRSLVASARELIARSSRELAGGDGQAWLAVGDAWAALGDVDQAWAAYELALAHGPSDALAVQRLAGCLEASGRSGHAERVLERAWQDWRDPRVGVALAELQERRGLLRQAARTRAQVLSTAAETGAGGTGQTPDAARTAQALTGAGGVTWLSRPGEAGTSALTGWLVPVAAAVALPGRWQLDLQAVPYQLSNAAEVTRHAALGLGVSTRIGDPLTLQARIGTGPLDPRDPAHWTWDGLLTTSLGQRGEVSLGVHRAPVMESLASWSGAVDALDRPYGGVADTWVSGLGALRWRPATDLGLLVRAGAMAGDHVAPIGWQQLVFWGHRALLSADDRIRVGLEGLAFTHDRRSDGFTGGEAAAFTPTRFGQLAARLEGTWTHPEQSLRVCGSVGAGPQYQDGETLRFQDPGWAITGDGTLAAQWRVAEHWLLEGRAWGQATSTRWHQEVVWVSIRRLGPVRTVLPAAAPFSSPVHSPPLVPHRPCGTVPWGPR